MKSEQTTLPDPQHVRDVFHTTRCIMNNHSGTRNAYNGSSPWKAATLRLPSAVTQRGYQQLRRVSQFVLFARSRPKEAGRVLRSKLLTLSNALIITWVLMLFLGEKYAFQKSIYACDWCAWENWVCWTECSKCCRHLG